MRFELIWSFLHISTSDVAHKTLTRCLNTSTTTEDINVRGELMRWEFMFTACHIVYWGNNHKSNDCKMRIKLICIGSLCYRGWRASYANSDERYHMLLNPTHAGILFIVWLVLTWIKSCEAIPCVRIKICSKICTYLANQLPRAIRFVKGAHRLANKKGGTQH